MTSWVKWAFEQPEHAAGELRALVPPELAARIQWDTLKLEPGSLVDEDLRELHTDLLFSAQLKDEGEGRQVLSYLLFEHQSTPDRLMAVRLLVYVSRVLGRWLRQHPGGSPHPCDFADGAVPREDEVGRAVAAAGAGGLAGGCVAGVCPLLAVAGVPAR